jgi:lipoyl-dependent peroxiredoxin subunit D
MSWVDDVKAVLPDYAKDTKLNLDSVINRSTLDPEEAQACALAAAMSAGNGKIQGAIMSGMTSETEMNAALTAASLMAQNNVWYPYVEMAEIRTLRACQHSCA